MRAFAPRVPVQLNRSKQHTDVRYVGLVPVRVQRARRRSISVSRRSAMDVVVGFVTGEGREGLLESFNPAGATLVLASSGPSRPDVPPLTLATRDLAYVGFASEPPVIVPAHCATQQARVRVHVSGGRTFLVRGEAEDMKHPLDFFAVSLDEETRFA